ncbi:hypothetical protein C8J57DRAFT_1509259 [Mycena rebaudengoi]|nr:hypothetical protein C8J57DRAFT_1509259 [Mycena rebaudengoi]
MNESRSCLDKLAHKVGPKLAHTRASMDFVAHPEEIRRYVEAVQERKACTESDETKLTGSGPNSQILKKRD